MCSSKPTTIPPKQQIQGDRSKGGSMSESERTGQRRSRTGDAGGGGQESTNSRLLFLGARRAWTRASSPMTARGRAAAGKGSRRINSRNKAIIVRFYGFFRRKIGLLYPLADSIKSEVE
jgi:hypothetical protein